MRWYLGFALVALALLFAGGMVSGTAHAAGAAPAGPLTTVPVSPSPGSVVYTETPVIQAHFVDSFEVVDPGSVTIVVDRINVTAVAEVVITPINITYSVPQELKLKPGLHNVTVNASDASGNRASVTWNFTVSSSGPPAAPLISIDPRSLVLEVGAGAGLVAAGYWGYIYYLRTTRRFSFQKYFAVHPIEKIVFTLYLPLLGAFVFVFFGLIAVLSESGLPWYSLELVFIGGLFIGVTSYAVEARAEAARIKAYERAFAQFLFEMSDAMRGGIDPAKAIIELSKTTANILQKQLRIAADAIKLGRPMDQVLRDMAVPLKSKLIARYAGLIGDSANIGGETSAVVYRAAKDMDEFIKVETERGQQLYLPVAVIYISFGVLMAVLFALLSIAPSLGSINVSLIGGLPAAGSSLPPQTSHLDFPEMRQRFFDLALIVSIGNGAIIGAFTEGNPKYGLLHALAMVAATLAVFAILFP